MAAAGHRGIAALRRLAGWLRHQLARFLDACRPWPAEQPPPAEADAAPQPGGSHDDDGFSDMTLLDIQCAPSIGRPYLDHPRERHGR